MPKINFIARVALAAGSCLLASLAALPLQAQEQPVARPAPGNSNLPALPPQPGQAVQRAKPPPAAPLTETVPSAQSLAPPAAPAAQPPAPTVRPAEPAPANTAYDAARKRWKTELSAFTTADQAHPPATGGILFVGGSTIRLWTDLAQDFRAWPIVINRGFGGSTMEDWNLFARDLVLRYQPTQVVVYAGDNDLAEGRSPLQVLDSFVRFVTTVRSELPAARISFISIKPSPSREKLLVEARQANDMIAAYLRRLPNSAYIDIFTPMLDADGRARAELFQPDRLHLNASGYRLWQGIVANSLGGVDAAALAQTRR